MAIPQTIRTIVLTGFMGAGKSTVGPLLAQTLGWDFLDADTAIETKAGMTIVEVFMRHGEESFRALEAEAIREHADRTKLVLALGGGALEAEGTRTLLATHKHACLIFLDAPLEVLVTRCMEQPGAAERPVLANREGLVQRFNTRLPYYREAHLIIATEGLSPDEVVAKIMNAVEKIGSTEPAVQGTTIG